MDNNIINAFNDFMDPRISENQKIVTYDKRSGQLLAATSIRLVIELTSTRRLDYAFMTDFFLAYRSFMNPYELLKLLFCRLSWAFSLDDELHRFARIRTFVTLRHWLLNYFADDWVPNLELRKFFAYNLSCLLSNVQLISIKINNKILSELKLIWCNLLSLHGVFNKNIVNNIGINNNSSLDTQGIPFGDFLSAEGHDDISPSSQYNYTPRYFYIDKMKNKRASLYPPPSISDSFSDSLNNHIDTFSNISTQYHKNQIPNVTSKHIKKINKSNFTAELNGIPHPTKSFHASIKAIKGSLNLSKLSNDYKLNSKPKPNDKSLEIDYLSLRGVSATNSLKPTSLPKVSKVSINKRRHPSNLIPPPCSTLPLSTPSLLLSSTYNIPSTPALFSSREFDHPVSNSQADLQSNSQSNLQASSLDNLQNNSCNKTISSTTQDDNLGLINIDIQNDLNKEPSSPEVTHDSFPSPAKGFEEDSFQALDDNIGMNSFNSENSKQFIDLPLSTMDDMKVESLFVHQDNIPYINDSFINEISLQDLPDQPSNFNLTPSLDKVTLSPGNYNLKSAVNSSSLDKMFDEKENLNFTQVRKVGSLNSDNLKKVLADSTNINSTPTKDQSSLNISNSKLKKRQNLLIDQDKENKENSIQPFMKSDVIDFNSAKKDLLCTEIEVKDDQSVILRNKNFENTNNNIISNNNMSVTIQNNNNLELSLKAREIGSFASNMDKSLADTLSLGQFSEDTSVNSLVSMSDGAFKSVNDVLTSMQIQDEENFIYPQPLGISRTQSDVPLHSTDSLMNEIIAECRNEQNFFNLAPSSTAQISIAPSADTKYYINLNERILNETLKRLEGSVDDNASNYIQKNVQSHNLIITPQVSNKEGSHDIDPSNYTINSHERPIYDSSSRVSSGLYNDAFDVDGGAMKLDNNNSNNEKTSSKFNRFTLSSSILPKKEDQSGNIYGIGTPKDFNKDINNSSKYLSFNHTNSNINNYSKTSKLQDLFRRKSFKDKNRVELHSPESSALGDPEEILSLEKSLNYHYPFILNYDSIIIAQHMTMIEKDLLHEVDWLELMNLEWSSGQENLDSWEKYISSCVNSPHGEGTEVILTRFNLMSGWVTSEIILTLKETEKSRVISQFIHIANDCLEMKNFATFMQIILALTSSRIQKLSKAWDYVSRSDKDLYQQLEIICSPIQNFSKLRAQMRTANSETGCIPFVGLSLSDLTFNSERDMFILQPKNKYHASPLSTAPLSPPSSSTIDLLKRPSIVSNNDINNENALQKEETIKPALPLKSSERLKSKVEDKINNYLTNSEVLKNLDSNIEEMIDKYSSVPMIFFDRFRACARTVQALIQQIQWSKAYMFEIDEVLLNKCLYIASLSDSEIKHCLKRSNI